MGDAFLLNVVLYLPVAGMILLLAVPESKADTIRWFTFWLMVVQLALTTVLYVHFDPAAAGLQFETRAPWIPDWGVYYQIGLDAYNVLLVAADRVPGAAVVAGAFTAITQDFQLFYSMCCCPVRDAGRVVGACSCSTSSGRRWAVPLFLLIASGGERRFYAAQVLPVPRS